MDPTHVEIVKATVTKWGCAHLESFGPDVTVFSLRVGDTVVARFKVTATEDPDLIGDLIRDAVQSTTPCYLIMPGVMKLMPSLPE
ncbi:hypothetical protein AURDEDRAFT_168313 [Auricularia subglabra TFB-10046 SS5]|nr:hypothetical protein AURDEDRAFT_168313 [Auricularia subglabra TFB-10046 SS5]